MADLNTAEGDEVGSVECNSPQAKRKSNDTGLCEHPNEQLSNLKLEVNGLHKMFEEESHKVNKNIEKVTHQVNKNIEEVANQVNYMQKNMKEVTHQVNTMQKNVEDQTQQTKLLFVEVKKAIEHSNNAYDAMALRYDKLEMEVLNAKKGSPDVCLIGASASPIFKGKTKEGDLRTQSADKITVSIQWELRVLTQPEAYRCLWNNIVENDEPFASSASGPGICKYAYLSIQIDDEQTTKGSDDKNESVDDASPLKCDNRDSRTTDDTEQQSPILSHLRDYAERSTMHGVLRLFINGRNLRMFWGILLISVLGISMWQFVGIFHDYCEYPVYIDTRVQNKPPTCPQILVCLANYRVKKSALFQHPVLKNITNNFTKNKNKWWSYIMDLPKDDIFQLNFAAHEFLHVNVYTEQGWTAYTPTLVLMEGKGICYRIDLQENREVREISLVLNENKHDSFQIEWNYDHFAYLYLLPDYTTSSYQLQTSTITYMPIRVSTANWIRFQLEKYNRLNGVYGQCQDDEELFRKRTGFNYTRGLCERECKLMYDIKTCKCYTNLVGFPLGFQHPDLSGVRKCSRENDSDCISAARRLFTRHLDCQCKERCQTSIYTSNIRENDISTGFPSYYCDMFNSQFCSNTINAIKWVKENIATVYITPLKHSYKEFTQKPLYPFSRFISDIGGTLGFYCGSSVLTVFEVIQLVLALMMYLFSSLRARYQA